MNESETVRKIDDMESQRALIPSAESSSSTRAHVGSLAGDSGHLFSIFSLHTYNKDHFEVTTFGKPPIFHCRKTQFILRSK